VTTELTDHWRKSFDNLYLGSWNLWVGGKYVTAKVTIERVAREMVTMQGGRKSQETLLYFRGKRTPMILTKKMGRNLQSMYGPTPAQWLGKPITLYVECGFKTRDGPADVLRIRNDRAGDALKRQLGGAVDDESPPPAPETFEDAGDDPDRGP
jgi:hypothetical protein